MSETISRTVETEIDLKCSLCLVDLEWNYKIDRYEALHINVTPCPSCLEDAETTNGSET